MSGLYITLEGPEACGKTTQVSILSEALKERFPDREILLTKEPGSGFDAVCLSLRQLILDPINSPCEKTALLMFLADRAQHLDKVVKPALQRGAIVISDRSSLSTIVYHMAAVFEKTSSTHIGSYMETVYPMLDFAQDIKPDICFMAFAEFEWAIQNMKSRARGLDRIEQFDDSFHRRIHSLFHLLEYHINDNSADDSDAYFKGITSKLKCLPKQVVELPLANLYSVGEISKQMLDKVMELL